MISSTWQVSSRHTEPERECSHLDQANSVPDPDPVKGCEDCLREGTRWLHLRQCLVCGGIRCCDNSPRRHSRAHYHAAGHPLMRSAEPGETWGWCYSDELSLEPA
ncbi:MAG TPA: UBP-type zinc finger domain-containing protein [Jiangellaceae bacterium]|nr:UBP-type zinc finger domain-containing protein [Jiangellaceae bacterium]